MTVPEELVPANFVPAAAVKRRGLVLLVITGRKGFVGGLFFFEVKNGRNSSTLKRTLS